MAKEPIQVWPSWGNDKWSDPDASNERIAIGPSDATDCSRCADHEKLLRIFSQIDEIMHTMRPRYVQHPTMDGRYPCWIVWLPKTGKTERKILKDAMIEYVDQVAEIHHANAKS